MTFARGLFIKILEFESLGGIEDIIHNQGVNVKMLRHFFKPFYLMTAVAKFEKRQFQQMKGCSLH
jgi:hypothetical protein